MYPGGEGRLPRRIPLSERTGGASPAAPRDDDGMFGRLFRPSKNTESFRQAPPDEGGKD